MSVESSRVLTFSGISLVSEAKFGWDLAAKKNTLGTVNGCLFPKNLAIP